MTKTQCYHCGDTCENEAVELDGKPFCCSGCKTVYEILNQHNLGKYYSIENAPGIKNKKHDQHRYQFLDVEEIAAPLFDFIEKDKRVVRLFLPNIHCTSCIWLLENLNYLNNGVIYSQVDFLKKEALISFNIKEVSFSEVATLLDKIGYTPKFDIEKKAPRSKKIYLKLGLTFFCFGNIMLFSFPEYLNPDDTFLIQYRRFFSYLTFIFSLPIIAYSAKDYLVAAFKALSNKFLNLDVPISLGILTLYFKSVYDVFTGNGPGYMDSFAGFILFLLVGKWFQDKTYQALSFDRNYKSYFPLSVTQILKKKEIIKPVKDIEKGDELLIKNDEIIPADAIILKGNANIDYSFVTGESEFIRMNEGEQVYAGGKLVGKSIYIKVLNTLNQSYLTQLWNQHAFKKEDTTTLKALNTKWSSYFIIAVLSISIFAGALWSFIEPQYVFNVVVSVLIVACPCALALSIPFTFGNALRVAGENKLYLKNIDVIEKLGKVTDIVFDKTGTLTYQNRSSINFIGELLTERQEQLVFSLVRNSSHPLSRMLYEHLKSKVKLLENITDYKEEPGQGIVGKVLGQQVCIGSAQWVGQKQTTALGNLSTSIYIKIADNVLGYYKIENKYRPGFIEIIKELKRDYKLHVLSGDNESEKENLMKYFSDESTLHFNQKPMDKLNYIKSIKNDQRMIMMIGDGLNDAGALKQSDIGIVISEDIYNFTPACDGILDADMFNKIPAFIRLGKYSLRVLKVSYIVSLLYNLFGLAFALSNQLSPLVAAILMPLSSISVVVITTLLIRIYSSKKF